MIEVGVRGVRHNLIGERAFVDDHAASEVETSFAELGAPRAEFAS